MLTLRRVAYRAIVAHAKAGAPEEVCGVLAGHRRDDGTVSVGEAHAVENLAARPRTEYRLDPEALLAVFEELGAESRDVVGFYHSHPAGPPHPSPTDEARATWPGYVYVIVSLDGEPELNAWTWTGERFEPETVRLVD